MIFTRLNQNEFVIVFYVIILLKVLFKPFSFVTELDAAVKNKNQ